MAADAVQADEQLVLPDAPARTGVSIAELLSSFYLWLVCWLVVWVAVPALVIGWQPVLITSGSMGPTISAGDLILLGTPPGPDEDLLAPGAVITFRDPTDPDALITHRIDDAREDGLYRTRGDANGQPDATPVAPQDVIGVGRMLVPLVGLPILWLRSDLLSFGLFLGGTLAAVVVASSTHHAGRRRPATADETSEGEDASDDVASGGGAA